MKQKKPKILFTLLLFFLTYSSQSQDSGSLLGFDDYKLYLGRNLIYSYSPLLLFLMVILLAIFIKNFIQKEPNSIALRIYIASVLFGLFSYFGTQYNDDLIMQIRLNLGWIISVFLCLSTFVLLVWKMNRIGGLVTLMVIALLSGICSPQLLKMI